MREMAVPAQGHRSRRRVRRAVPARRDWMRRLPICSLTSAAADERRVRRHLRLANRRASGSGEPAGDDPLVRGQSAARRRARRSKRRIPNASPFSRRISISTRRIRARSRTSCLSFIWRRPGIGIDRGARTVSRGGIDAGDRGVAGIVPETLFRRAGLRDHRTQVVESEPRCTMGSDAFASTPPRIAAPPCWEVVQR